MIYRTLLCSGLVALAGAQTDAAETSLVISVGTQTGFFKTHTDIGPLNPHDYRPNEFVTSDFIFEGLVAWDGEHPKGQDGEAGTDDDFAYTCKTLSSDPHAMYPSELALRPTKFFSFV